MKPLVFCLLMAWFVSASGLAYAQASLPYANHANPANPANLGGVVSLTPNITELVFALGAGNALSGRTRHCSYPPEATALPVVGSYFRPDVERIVALRPRLCLAMEDGTPPELVRRLRRAGVVVEILQLAAVEDVPEVLRRLGVLLERQEAAERLAAGVEGMIAALRRKVAAAPNTPSVLIQIQAGPLMVAGPQSFCGKLVTLAGGRVVPDTASLYPRLSSEHALALNPDIILVLHLGSGVAESLVAWKRFSQLSAVRAGRVHAVDGDVFSRPGLRGIESLPVLSDLLREAP